MAEAQTLQTPLIGNAVLAAYEARVAEEGLSRDPAQVALACALDELREELLDARPGWRPFFRRRKGWDAVKGLYIWGAVGRGKTMLMDLFHDALPLREKRRAHFNDFMRDVHARVATLRRKGEDAAVPKAAEAIAEEVRVLSFDEFAVTDIADAMILARLFDTLFDRGVTLVATSNVAPGDLYADGLNRALFLPFLRKLRENVTIFHLDAAADYRLDRLEDRRVWFGPDDPGFDRLWLSLCAGRSEGEETLSVGSRTLTVPRACGSFARVTFAEVCDAPLGTADFSAIAARFHTVFLQDIPIMTPARRETLRRFINLIDVFYDAHVRLVVSAQGEPGELFERGEGGAEAEAFAFQRTQSRLYEMRSASYLNALETTPLG